MISIWRQIKKIVNYIAYFFFVRCYPIAVVSFCSIFFLTFFFMGGFIGYAIGYASKPLPPLDDSYNDLFISLIIALFVTWFGIFLFLKSRPRVLIGSSWLSIHSFSLYELCILATAKDDRADAIKQVYDWNNSIYTLFAKSLLTFLFAQAGLLVKYAIDPSTRFETADPIACLLALAITLLIMIEFYLIGLIRRIPQEYSSAITLYSKLRK